MKIKKIEVSNFRNIKHNVLDFTAFVNILTGANNIGKSNTLNAVNWFVTNTLLTDKWGSGENDLNSIVPINAAEKDYPSVKVTFEDGSTFTKTLKRNSSGGNKTEYRFNDASGYNSIEWQEMLFNKLGFSSKLKCKKDVNELRVFTDPLYALQKLEPKHLRELLVDLGCSVTNDEVFNKVSKFTTLKAYESKYMGDFTKMRQDLKNIKQEQTKQLEALGTTLEGYVDVEEYTPEERESLETKRDDLTVKIRNLKKGDSNLTNEIELEIQKITSEKELFITEEKAKRNQEVALLKEKLRVAREEAYSTKNAKLTTLNEKLRDKYTSKASLTASIKAYETTRENKKQECLKIKSLVEEYQKKIEANNNYYEEVSKREFIGYVTCPVCGKVFAPDETALVLFNKQKQDDLQRIKDENSRLNIEIVEKQKQFETDLTLGRNARDNQEETQKKLETLEEEISDINNEIMAISTKDVDLSKVTEIQTQIEAVDMFIDTSKWDEQLKELENKKDDLVINQAQANQTEIDRLENELAPIKEAIENEYMKQSKYASKLEFEAKYKNVAAELNDTESLLELVNEFIQKKISLINAKAREITGIDFVMLEDNLTNDNIREVCYATVNGVEFGNVNTSQKLEVGIKFIHRIKEILGSNDLPILADRLEGFDDIEKIRNLTTEQMICTVVGNKEQKEIVII